MSDPLKQLSALVDIARRAGDAILEVYAGDIDVQHKEDSSPLTQADLASHAVIRDALAELTPDIPLLSEESADGPSHPHRRSHRRGLLRALLGGSELRKTCVSGVTHKGSFVVFQGWHTTRARESVRERGRDDGGGGL